MAKGRYLSIGLNRVDAERYDGWPGELMACENDARDLEAIAKKAGLTGTSLLTKAATSTAVLGELLAAAKELEPGDLFVLAYSGHGSQITDTTADEPDQLDETWCLYDRMLVDDEFDAMWRQFKPGVRVFMLSDSCHSGSVAKGAPPVPGEKRAPEPTTGRVKALAIEKSLDLYVANRVLYDSLQYVAGPGALPESGASVILISSCGDDQRSRDGETNSVFTGALKLVWDEGRWGGTYAQFCAAIKERTPPSQTPNYYRTGPSNPAFEAQKPFLI